MAYIGTAYLAMAYMVVACIVMANIGVACIVMACIVMACIAMQLWLTRRRAGTCTGGVAVAEGSMSMWVDVRSP